jgi:hypothetical protein
MRKLLILSSVFMGLSNQLAQAQPSCKQIDEAISANEDFVEVALGIDKLPLAPALQTIKSTLKKLDQALTANFRDQSSTQINVIETQVSSGELALAAVAAIENYKVLITAFDSRLATTFDTAMLDYAGFKLLSLTATKTLDWPAMSKTVGESKQSWKKTKGLIKDQAVIDLVDSTQAALDDALTAKDAAWLSSAAQILLDSVDLVERYSKNTSKSACT